MTQDEFARCLGRMILDPTFRLDFLSRPEATLTAQGIHLSEEHRRLLERVPLTPMLELAASLAVPPPRRNLLHDHAQGLSRLLDPDPRPAEHAGDAGGA